MKLKSLLYVYLKCKQISTELYRDFQIFEIIFTDRFFLFPFSLQISLLAFCSRELSSWIDRELLE